MILHSRFLLLVRGRFITLAFSLSSLILPVSAPLLLGNPGQGYPTSRPGRAGDLLPARLFVDNFSPGRFLYLSAAGFLNFWLWL